MTLVKGHYRIVGASPDGDSVRFYPQDPGVREAAGMAVRTNSTGGVQLRLDAIDALETHYTPPHGWSSWRRPVDLGDGAASALLDLLGFRDVKRDKRGYVTAATPEQTPGYILTRFADKCGRAVATAFPGGRRGRATDGSSVYLDVDELHRSVSYQLLAAGWESDVLRQVLRRPARRAGCRCGGRPGRQQRGVGRARHAGRLPSACITGPPEDRAEFSAVAGVRSDEPGVCASRPSSP